MRYSHVFLLAACSLVVLGRVAVAQTADDGGPEQIFLEEPRPTPPPRAMGQKTYVEQYADESTRVKRRVKLMSDDSVINHGPYEEYWRNGEKFSEGVFKEGVHDGEWSFWHPNGQLSRTVNFIEGRPDGKWQAFREDGSLLADRAYADGKRIGTWLVYHPDGKTVRLELPYVEGQIHGLRKSFYVNGQVRQEAPHTKGEVDGLVTEWDEAGRKVLEAEFEKGKQKGKVLYQASGRSSETKETDGDETGDTIEVDESEPEE